MTGHSTSPNAPNGISDDEPSSPVVGHGDRADVMDAAAPARRFSWRLVTGIALAAAIVGVAFFLPVQQYLIAIIEWSEASGPWGPVVLAALYVPACLLFLPGSLLTLGGGFAFGVLRAAIAVSVGSTLGATAAFVCGRTLARGMIERRVAASPRFAALDRAVADQGFKIVLLTRLSPVFPFNLLNYAFGLSRVRLRDYVLASWIGMMPGTIMYAYLGSAAKSLAELASGKVESGRAGTALFLVGLAATIGVTTIITRIARRALTEAIDSPGSEAVGDRPL